MKTIVFFKNPYGKSVQTESLWKKNEEAGTVDMKSLQGDTGLN